MPSSVMPTLDVCDAAVATNRKSATMTFVLQARENIIEFISLPPPPGVYIPHGVRRRR